MTRACTRDKKMPQGPLREWDAFCSFVGGKASERIVFWNEYVTIVCVFVRLSFADEDHDSSAVNCVSYVSGGDYQPGNESSGHMLVTCGL